MEGNDLIHLNELLKRGESEDDVSLRGDADLNLFACRGLPGNRLLTGDRRPNIGRKRTETGRRAGNARLRDGDRRLLRSRCRRRGGLGGELIPRGKFRRLLTCLVFNGGRVVGRRLPFGSAGVAIATIAKHRIILSPGAESLSPGRPLENQSRDGKHKKSGEGGTEEGADDPHAR